MKFLVAVVLCALFSSAFGENATDAEIVDALVKCALRAANTGIDGLIPPHDILHIENFNFSQSVIGVKYYFEITNNLLYSLMDLEIRKEKVTSYQAPDAVNIDYDIYWPVLNFTGDFAYYYEVFGIRNGGNGTYNIVLKHTDFSGLFYYIKPGQQNYTEQVNDFTLDIIVKNADVHLTGAGPAWLSETVLEMALLVALNNVPSSAADFLREQRFNDYWIGHHERIDKVVEWCKVNLAV